MKLIAWCGAQFIYALIFVFGRVFPRGELTWLEGPLGGETIGDTPYRETCDAEGLTLERHAQQGALIPDLEVLRSPTFDPSRVHARVREFYEATTAFSIDVWSRSYFPASLALWVLVKTLSRQVNQLNFPLSPLDTARGMKSEIISMRRPDGSLRYTGWMRSLPSGEVVFTGFYLTEFLPAVGARCVKTVFPMPHGNATVLLQPSVGDDGALELDSGGGRFGAAGFYRVQEARGGLRVWLITTLKEHFRVYADGDCVRADHSVRFLGLPVLTLHYKIFKK